MYGDAQWAGEPFHRTLGYIFIKKEPIVMFLVPLESLLQGLNTRKKKCSEIYILLNIHCNLLRRREIICLPKCSKGTNFFKRAQFISFTISD